MSRKKRLFFSLVGLIYVLGISQSFAASDLSSLDLLDPSDAEILNAKDDIEQELKSIDLSKAEELDDLENLKTDIGDIYIEKKARKKVIPKKIVKKDTKRVKEKSKRPFIFDVGAEERKLLDASKYIVTKIPENEWNEILTSSKVEKYIIQKGDWLWKISKNLFGSGFYYAKIWALNPYITNPHEIKPGMALVFNTGDADTMPKVTLDSFENTVLRKTKKGGTNSVVAGTDLSDFADNAVPPWIIRRNKLIKQGVYIQYSSDVTYEDLGEISAKVLEDEYKKYAPPQSEIEIREPVKEYDESGFDRSSFVDLNIKEGFFLNTFLTTNIVQDLGVIDSAQEESLFLGDFTKIYIKFDTSAKVKPGDRFSIYSTEGKVGHKVSERIGYRYTIIGQIKALRKIGDKWECLIIERTGIIQRGDRITLYTPKIKKILRTFNSRRIEAVILGSFRPTAGGMSYGDVVYIDRGRADGVELGNVFSVYSFEDRGTGKKITSAPTYRIGELTVISITDNFATALISLSHSEIREGALTITKTQEEVARNRRIKSGEFVKEAKKLEDGILDELDVDLNLNELDKDLLERANQIDLTEDELEELEKQEKNQSIIKEHERDLRELERLEDEIEGAENKINQVKLDEDSFLDQQDLEKVENNFEDQDKDAFGQLDELEKEIGLKYMDQNLDQKENPYGLTKFDLEEIDDLLNTDGK